MHHFYCIFFIQQQIFFVCFNILYWGRRTTVTNALHECSVTHLAWSSFVCPFLFFFISKTKVHTKQNDTNTRLKRNQQLDKQTHRSAVLDWGSFSEWANDGWHQLKTRFDFEHAENWWPNKIWNVHSNETSPNHSKRDQNDHWPINASTQVACAFARWSLSLNSQWNQCFFFLHF